MINHKTNIPISELSAHPAAYMTKDMLLLDIETTGLSASKHFIYCIGCSYLEENTAVIQLFFGCGEEEERSLLLAFHELLAAHSVIVTFNGNTFDLPFLSKRFALCQIQDPFSDKTFVDLYREARNLKALLKLDSYRQKSVEMFLGCSRIDQYSGKELISVYHTYCKNPNEATLALLLQHNLDDVKGMYELFALFSYQKFCSGDFQIVHIFCEREGEEDVLNFLLKPGLPFPQCIHHYNDYCKILLDNDRALIQLPVCRGTLKHFFADYKNYYYLPEEDAVIHKSVASYVDANHREKVKKENCFIKKNCVYLLLPYSTADACLRKEYKDSHTYLDLTKYQNAENAFSIPKEDYMLFSPVLLHLLKNEFFR